MRSAFFSQLSLLVLACWASTHAWAQERLSLARNLDVPSEINALVLREVYAKLGVTLDIRPMAAARAQLETLAGHVDGEVNRVASYAVAHPTLIKVEPPLSTWVVSAFYRSARITGLQGPADLAGRRVGHVRGIAGAEPYAKPAAEVLLAVNSAQLLGLLMSGRVDVAVDGVPQFRASLAEDGNPPVQELVLGRYELFHLLTPKHRALALKVSATLARLAASGELQTMHERATQSVQEQHARGRARAR